MTKEELQEMFDADELSEEALSVIENVLNNNKDLEDDDEIDDEKIFQEVDSALIYYSDAYNYLSQNVPQGDFSDAINEYGAKTATDIAAYYLIQEILG